MPDWMDDDLADRRRRGLFRVRRRIESAQGVHLRVAGRDLLSFASNDYLGLAADPRQARAAGRAARRFGTGAGASPLVVGRLPPHRALERALADWEGTDAALTLSSGYAANLAVLSAAAGPADAVFSDALNHASLIDGCRLSRAAVHIYRHGDAGHLADLLRRHGPTARRRVVVSDAVFSMDGDVAAAADLLALAERHDALLVLDTAHATGVLPAPLVAPCDRLITVGTLSKALGSQGGFVAGPWRTIRWLVNVARPYIFSTALSVPAAAAARAAVRVARSEPQRREHLARLSALLRGRLAALGFAVRPDPTPIVPVIVGDPDAAVALSARLLERGLLVPAIRPPSVPEGTSRLRVSLSADHTEADVTRLVAELAAG
jgi:8-amino-7-oxononanoate synthase